MKHLLESFLNKLDNNDPKLMEAIHNGFHAIFEGYADVRDPERPDALSMFNQQAANLALSQGNPVLQFLQNSAASRANMFTYDDEPELDDFDTSDFNPVQNRRHVPRPEESNLGLTARDLAVNKSSDDDWQYQNWNSHDDWSDLAD